MSLLAAAKAAQNEEVKDNDAAAATQTQATPAEVAQAALKQHQAVAVAQQTAGALAKAHPKYDTRVLENLKDALPVDFNTLPQVQANQGQFRDKESQKPIGDQIMFQLMSWQSSWVVSPNNLSAPKDLVKYGDNPDVAKDGTDMNEHLATIRQKYPKASKQERVTLVGCLLDSARETPLKGQLVQIDCAPTSRAMFLRYKINSVFQMKSGARSDENVLTMKLTATAAKGPDNADFTRIDFDFGLAAGE